MTERKAAGIKFLILDVDGVLTDGRIILNDRGEETKSFDVKDGQGLKMLMNSGVEVALVTGRQSEVLSRRAEELGILEVYQGVSDKGSLCRGLIDKKGLKRQEVCCMGDDLPDLAMFMEAGLCIAVADAVNEVQKASDFITVRKGGYGAVREVCDLIIKSRGKGDCGFQDS
ncbi:MAG: HAD hydrolase family protein [Deltaproteobacteria bacterium]|nr:HAD hydrolase family protein [Deltaproteobacteria bacterium]